LYLHAYRTRLTDKEREALQLVEVGEFSYQKAADTLRLRYDNLKMVVCRARRKIADGIATMVGRASNVSYRQPAPVAALN